MDAFAPTEGAEATEEREEEGESRESRGEEELTVLEEGRARGPGVAGGVEVGVVEVEEGVTGSDREAGLRPTAGLVAGLIPDGPEDIWGWEEKEEQDG